VFNSEPFHTVEVPGANGISSGAAMASIGAMLCGRGAVTGGEPRARVLSSSTWAQMMGQPVRERDAHIGVTTEFSQGGMADMSGMLPFIGHFFEGFYGWCGWGGSFLLFNPELDVSIGVAVTGWKHDLYEDQRLVQILKALKPCLPVVQRAQ
jgi:CubicO group peptidase (beta-lactamase class C family)